MSGPSEADTFWSPSSRAWKSLARRGLRGVKLVIWDAHEGLKAAIRRVVSASWQRGRVHWMGNALAYVPQEMLWGERRSEGPIVAVTTDGVPHAATE